MDTSFVPAQRPWGRKSPSPTPLTTRKGLEKNTHPRRAPACKNTPWTSHTGSASQLSTLPTQVIGVKFRSAEPPVSQALQAFEGSVTVREHSDYCPRRKKSFSFVPCPQSREIEEILASPQSELGAIPGVACANLHNNFFSKVLTRFDT